MSPRRLHRLLNISHEISMARLETIGSTFQIFRRAWMNVAGLRWRSIKSSPCSHHRAVDECSEPKLIIKNRRKLVRISELRTEVL